MIARCRTGYFILVIFLLSSCWEYSPNQVFDEETPVNLNAININKIITTPHDDTITIAFVGDSQRFYDELDKFIEKANTIPSLDFVILAGDITDFGLLEEYKLIQNMLAQLNVPYISVIGNHDVLAHGEEVFERMFGPMNDSFIYNDVKFVLHNTNGREYLPGKVPDMNFLQHEFAPNDSAKYFIGVSHIPPFHEDFDQQLEIPYANLNAKTPGFLLSLHGHTHEFKDSYPYEGSINYITSFSFAQRSFVLLKIHNGKVIKDIIDY
jgi:3',5'-cyclic-AMP phosphodiesterase